MGTWGQVIAASIFVAAFSACDTPVSDGSIPFDTPANSVCGNYTVEVGEACDDGNVQDGDGCSAACEAEGNILGCRVFNISADADGGLIGLPGVAPNFVSGVFSSAAPGSDTEPPVDLSEFFMGEGEPGMHPSDALTLCAGEPDAQGAAPLELQSDVVVAVPIVSTCACSKYLNKKDVGTLYCGAHSDPIDVLLSMDSAGAVDGNTTVETLSGAVSGEGHLLVHVPLTFTSFTMVSGNPSTACNVANCETAFADLAVTTSEVAFTTGAVRTRITNTLQGGDAEIAAYGYPFDDDATDGTHDCEDWTKDETPAILAGAGALLESQTLGASAIDVAMVSQISHRPSN